MSLVVIAFKAAHAELDGLAQHEQDAVERRDARRQLTSLETAERSLRGPDPQRQLRLRESMCEPALADQPARVGHQLNIADQVCMLQRGDFSPLAPSTSTATTWRRIASAIYDASSAAAISADTRISKTVARSPSFARLGLDLPALDVRQVRRVHPGQSLDRRRPLLPQRAHDSPNARAVGGEVAMPSNLAP